MQFGKKHRRERRRDRRRDRREPEMTPELDLDFGPGEWEDTPPQDWPQKMKILGRLTLLRFMLIPIQ